MKNHDELINKIFFKKYRILKKIGKGSFGSVYLGKNIYKEEYYAVKFEPKNQQDLILERESYLLYYLRGYGIPEIITYGHNTNYNILVQTLLGNSINYIFSKKDNKFSMKDCCMIGIQILDRLEYIHSKFIIHRDIKPDNFLVGNPDQSLIHIIDFGLAKKYMSSRTGKHAKFTINKKWSGTSRFASANSLRGVAQSRRDDLESLCYLLLYLMKGNLPWDNVYGINENEEILLIYKIKKYMKPELLFMNLPKETAEFFHYCKKLEYEQKPDYNFLRNLLLTILNYSEEKNDLHFSWINKDQNESNSYNLNNRFKRVIKRKNSSRQKLYDSLINKRINPPKRSESYNNMYLNKNENKVKKDGLIIKNVSPNLRHIKIKNLYKNEKTQKYKYIKKIPKGMRKIIIQTNNFKMDSLPEKNIIKAQTQTEKSPKQKINIIPLKNVSKISKNMKNNINMNKSGMKEKKIIFKKNLVLPKIKLNEINNEYYITRKNNSFNFKNNKKINIFNYIPNNHKNNNKDEFSNSIGLNKLYNINQNLNSKLNNIRSYKSLTKENNNKYYNGIDFNDSLNNNLLEINSVRTFNNNYVYNNQHNLNSINMNLINNNINRNNNSLQPMKKDDLSLINNYYPNYLNTFKRNNYNNLKKQERINLTNNNIQNNYNINIDINKNEKNENSLHNLKYEKIKKDIKIINIISPINRTKFYRKVKKNALSPNIQQINKTYINKGEQKKIFNKFLDLNDKNGLFEKYYSNAEIMKKYNKIQKEITYNKNRSRYENSWDGRNGNTKNYNIPFIKGDINSYNEIIRNSHNNIIRTSYSLRYVSPKSIGKYKCNF